MLIASTGFPAGILIDYGFEDYVGENGNASPAPGYIFGTTSQDRWNYHISAVEIITNGDTDCAGNAYEGTKYAHFQKYTGGYDDCGNDTAQNVNSRSNFCGGNYAYPTGTHDTTDLTTDMTTDIIVIRLAMRTTDSWKSDQGAIDSGNGHKFVRFYGISGESVVLYITYDGSDSTPRVVLYFPNASSPASWREVGVDWQDGNWHTWTVRITRNSTTNATMELWIDDWNMSGSPNTSRTDTANLGSGFDRMNISSNWSAQYPQTFMGYDIDAIEVWDGNPTDLDPELLTATIAADGESLTLAFDQNVDQGSGYEDADWDIDASSTGNGIGISYDSGDGTDTWLYTIDSTIQLGETVDIDFNGDTDSIENAANDDLAAIVSKSVTNNSTQSPDTDPPETSSHYPAKSDTGVDISDDIVVHVTDTGAGVDGTTIEMDVEGILYCCSDGGCANKTLLRSGTSADYTITHEHDDWGYSTEINVEIDADDLAGTPNSMTTDIYSFTTEATPDADSPFPNPAEWDTDPYDYSQTEIRMESSSGSDASPPISYQFNYDQGDSECASDGGTGGTDSSWQSGDTTYADTGLEVNQCYGYTVQMRDTVPNTGTASDVFAVYTKANAPGTPTLTNPADTTLDITNLANGNPATNPTTLFAIQCIYTSPSDASWLNKWVDASGDPVGAEVWLSDTAWDSVALQDLTPGTSYRIESKAKNEDDVETATSSEGQGTTTGGDTPVTSSGSSGGGSRN